MWVNEWEREKEKGRGEGDWEKERERELGSGGNDSKHDKFHVKLQEVCELCPKDAFPLLCLPCATVCVCVSVCLSVWASYPSSVSACARAMPLCDKRPRHRALPAPLANLASTNFRATSVVVYACTKEGLVPTESDCSPLPSSSHPPPAALLSTPPYNRRPVDRVRLDDTRSRQRAKDLLCPPWWDCNEHLIRCDILKSNRPNGSGLSTFPMGHRCWSKLWWCGLGWGAGGGRALSWIPIIESDQKMTKGLSKNQGWRGRRWDK